MPASMLQVKVIKSMAEVDRDRVGYLSRRRVAVSRMGLARVYGRGDAVPFPRLAGNLNILTVYDKKQLVAACPLYLKGNSMGEFVFDHSWADAAQRAGIEYYPENAGRGALHPGDRDTFSDCIPGRIVPP